MKSDLLLPNEVKLFIEKIEIAKTWMIYAATGQIEKNDAGVLNHLLDLNDLQLVLNDLLRNLEAELITYDTEKALRNLT